MMTRKCELSYRECIANSNHYNRFQEMWNQVLSFFILFFAPKYICVCWIEQTENMTPMDKQKKIIIIKSQELAAKSEEKIREWNGRKKSTDCSTELAQQYRSQWVWQLFIYWLL